MVGSKRGGIRGEKRRVQRGIGAYLERELVQMIARPRSEPRSPDPPKPIGVKNCRMSNIGQNRRPPNPLRLTCLFSVCYLEKRPCFLQKDGSASFSPRKFSSYGLSEASKPNRVKPSQINKIWQNLPRRTQRSYPYCFQKLSAKMGFFFERCMCHVPCRVPAPLRKSSANVKSG
jgi:hypothetical protein